MTDIRWIIEILMLLTFISMVFVCAVMMGYDLSKYSFKIKNKIYLVPFCCLIFILASLYYYWAHVLQHPLTKVSSASFEYYSCKEKYIKEDICVAKKNNMFAEIASAEVCGIEKNRIDKAVEEGMYKAKAKLDNNNDLNKR